MNRSDPSTQQPAIAPPSRRIRLRLPRLKTARGVFDARRVASTIAFFARDLHKHLGLLIPAGLAMLAATLLSLAAPWPVQVVLDHVILGRPARGVMSDVLARLGDPRNVLLAACAAVVLIAAARGLFEYASQILQADAAHRIGNKLRHRVFKHLQQLSLRFHERSRTGDLLLRLTGDITLVRDLLVASLFDLMAALLLLSGLLAMMFRLSPALAAVALATLPAVVAASWLTSVRLRAAVRKKREKEGDLISAAAEVLGAISHVQAFTREDAEKDRVSRLERSSLRAELKTVRLESKLARTVEIVTALGTCGILYLGVGDVLAGKLSPGTLIVFISYYTSLVKPIRQLAKTAGRMAKASSCADRVREVLDEVPEIQDAPDAVVAPPLAGHIRFERLRFDYEPGRPVLRDIHLDIPSGQRVALVGPTGAGKSTLMKLLLRFYDPTAGCVRVDGRDIREFRLESLRRQISVVQQHTVLFGTTLGDNIAMGRLGATRADVEAAARELGIEEWIASLPNGYDTIVGERGATLSGGQRQLVALARAILRGGRILIFDEPTTGLDGRTEQQIRRALQRAMRNRTTLIISHGLRPLADVDRVIVLTEGRIVQDGSHDDLRGEVGVYRELFELPSEPDLVRGAPA